MKIRKPLQAARAVRPVGRELVAPLVAQQRLGGPEVEALLRQQRAGAPAPRPRSGVRPARAGAGRLGPGPRGDCRPQIDRRLGQQVRPWPEHGPLSLVEALLQSDQEMMRQEHQRHVVVPGRPEAHLVVVQP